MHDERTITINIRVSNRGLRRLVVVAAVLALVIPTAAWAGHQFNDVPASNAFHDDIAWMRDSGVTAGCNPPANDEYCPSDNVTREQMAAFMRRLETEGVFLPADGTAADADLLDGKDSSAFLGVNAKAADADKLDGKDSSAFLGVSATAADAELLDGKDSSAFLGVSATAADAELLDGKDSSAFLGVGATAVDADLLDGKDSSAFETLFAVVEFDGTVLGGNGLTGVSHWDVGNYTLTWDSAITGCGWLGTVGSRNGGTTGLPRMITLNGDGPSDPVNAIRVRIMDESGTATDNSFSVAVHC